MSGVRVLMLKEALPTGGAERQLALIMRHLSPYWERRVWLMAGGPFAEAIAAAGHRVDISPRSSRFDVTPAGPLWRLLFTWRPDVVHSWDWMSTFAALPLCRLLGIPVVDATIRNGIVRRRGSVQRRLSQAGSTLVVANSEAGLRAWGVGPHKGRVVYNAFDPDRLSASEPRTGRETRNGGPHTVVMTGRMVAHKDFSALIAAARRLDHERPGGWRFLLLGDGPEQARLVADAGDLERRGIVRFVDPGLEVLPLVRTADIGVLMSREDLHREGCSNAIMEYMSCALPVVCSSSGGNPELVLAGQTGLLVSSGDVAALADALTFIVDRPETARAMGDAGRRRILDDFSVSRLLRATEQVYWDALA